MTATEIIRRQLERHRPDYDHRGHWPGCFGWMVTTDGPVSCSELCREARRIVAEGDVRQMALMEAR